jgi:hypothetical protein
LIRENVADGLADLCAALGLLENFRTDIGKPQIPRRPLEQPDAQLILELRHAPADGRDRHFEALCGFGEAPRLDDLGKYRQRIEVNHRLFVCCWQQAALPVQRNLTTGFGVESNRQRIVLSSAPTRTRTVERMLFRRD